MNKDEALMQFERVIKLRNLVPNTTKIQTNVQTNGIQST